MTRVKVERTLEAFSLLNERTEQRRTPKNTSYCPLGAKERGQAPASVSALNLVAR